VCTLALLVLVPVTAARLYRRCKRASAASAAASAVVATGKHAARSGDGGRDDAPSSAASAAVATSSQAATRADGGDDDAPSTAPARRDVGRAAEASPLLQRGGAGVAAEGSASGAAKSFDSGAICLRLKAAVDSEGARVPATSYAARRCDDV
jgi:hypothetical protein